MHFESPTSGVRFYDVISGSGHLEVAGGELHVGGSSAPLSMAVNTIKVGANSVDGTVVVSGAGSRLDTTGVVSIASDGALGVNNSIGVLTYQDQSSGTVGDVWVGLSLNSDLASAQLNVFSNSQLTTDSIRIAPVATSGASGTVTLFGFGSIEQTGSSTLEVGNAGGGTGTLELVVNSTFSTGTGTTTVRQTGSINIFSTSQFQANGDVDVVAGLFRANDAGGLQLAAGRTFTASSNGQVEFLQGTTLSPDTTWNIHSGSELDTGGLANAAGIGVGLTGGTTTLVVDGDGTTFDDGAAGTGGGSNWGMGGATADVTFSGGAQGTLGNLTLAGDFVSGTTATVRIESDSSILTEDLFLNDTGGAGTSATITVDGDLTNGPGTLTQTGASRLVLGSTTGDGTLTISEGATAVFFGEYAGSQGTTGAGAARMEGDLKPGNSPAAISFGGDLAFSPDAVFTAELGGPSPGSEHDQLNVDGAATLDGTLTVEWLDPYVPNAGDSFQIMTFGSRSGEFTQYDGLGSIDDLFLLPIYGDTALILYAGIRGDLNGDGAVDGLDVNIVSANLGSATNDYWLGDVNGDGAVNLVDIHVISAYFGQSAPPPMSAGSGSTGYQAVPEPSGWTLAAMAVFGLIVSAPLVGRKDFC